MAQPRALQYYVNIAIIKPNQGAKKVDQEAQVVLEVKLRSLDLRMVQNLTYKFSVHGLKWPRRSNMKNDSTPSVIFGMLNLDMDSFRLRGQSFVDMG